MKLFAPWLLAISLLACSAGRAAVVDVVPPTFGEALQPHVAIGPEHEVHVVFGKGESIFHTSARLPDLRFREPVRIGDLPKLALGMRRGPRVIASRGVVTVSAISHAQGDLHVWSSKDGGKSWGAPQRTNSVERSAREGMHAMASDRARTAVITWLDLRNGGMELWSASSQDGGLTWGENVRVYRSPDGHICECCHPSVAVGEGGKVVAMWRNWLDGSRDMYVATSADRGKTWGAAQKLGTGTWPLKGCPMDGGAIVITPSGQIETTWRRDKDIFACAPGQKEKPLAAAATHSVVFSDGDGLGYLWQEGRNLRLRRANAGEVQTHANAVFASVAVDETGDKVVVWESRVAERGAIAAEILPR
jgi:hypothetical protein